eukprot:30761-Pelagococcus_subviridis.AAC.6
MGGEMRRAKSLRIGVHHANGVVRGPRQSAQQRRADPPSRAAHARGEVRPRAHELVQREHDRDLHRGETFRVRVEEDEHSHGAVGHGEEEVGDGDYDERPERGQRLRRAVHVAVAAAAARRRRGRRRLHGGGGGSVAAVARRGGRFRHRGARAPRRLRARVAVVRYVEGVPTDRIQIIFPTNIPFEQSQVWSRPPYPSRDRSLASPQSSNARVGHGESGHQRCARVAIDPRAARVASPRRRASASRSLG